MRTSRLRRAPGQPDSRSFKTIWRVRRCFGRRRDQPCTCQAAKGEVGVERAARLHDRLNAAPVERMDPPNLGSEAWRIAEEMGWGRTYDAEYVALATLLDCRLVTLDTRLRRGADRLGMVITPNEL